MLKSMARKRKTRRVKTKHSHDEHLGPSQVALSAKQQTGGGTHQESRAERNKRTGRLRGDEKRRIKGGDYDD